MDYLLLAAGLAVLLFGAELLVDSSVAIAKRAKVSSFIIGLTIVGMGTSAPELFVSLSSAIDGHGDIAVGNIVGSNICNTFLILGASAVIFPFAIGKSIIKRDIPFGIFAAILLLFLAKNPFSDGLGLSRMDGCILLVLFFAYMAYTVYASRKNPKEEEAESRLAAKNLARAFGMSEAAIAITVVAVGTSLPELITSIVAAVKKNSELALGNVIGSNVFNILLILGLSSAVKPIEISNVRTEDFAVMIFAALCSLLVAFTFRKRFFDRIEGIVFLVFYAGYTARLLLCSTTGGV